jgi:hypothetical protein
MRVSADISKELPLPSLPVSFNGILTSTRVLRLRFEGSGGARFCIWDRSFTGEIKLEETIQTHPLHGSNRRQKRNARETEVFGVRFPFWSV